MGKVKIQAISKIENKSKLNSTFHKRKRGFLKKAIELSSLCDLKIFMVIYDKEKQSLINFSST